MKLTKELIKITLLKRELNKKLEEELDPSFAAWNKDYNDLINKPDLSNLHAPGSDNQDLSALALKTNVLELDNTTPFTPDTDYEPATKKYVDDNAGGAPEGTAVKSTGKTGGTKFLRENGDGTCSWQAQSADRLTQPQIMARSLGC